MQIMNHREWKPEFAVSLLLKSSWLVNHSSFIHSCSFAMEFHSARDGKRGVFLGQPEHPSLDSPLLPDCFKQTCSYSSINFKSIPKKGWYVVNSWCSIAAKDPSNMLLIGASFASASDNPCSYQWRPQRGFGLICGSASCWLRCTGWTIRDSLNFV